MVLAAPEGSGCTSAALLLAHSTDARVAWCRLAAGYDTAADVVAAVGEQLGAEVEPARRVVELADQLLELFESGPLTVVIDDHHLSADGDLDRVVAECVGLLPADGRLVVAGATRPAGLLGLIPAGSLAVLGPDELAFDEAEAVALFDRHGGTPTDATRWAQELRGWAAGVAAGAHKPDGNPAAHLVTLLDELVAADPTGGRLVDALAATTSLSPDTAAALDLVVPPDALEQLVEAGPLLTDHDGEVRMTEAAAALRRSALADTEVAHLRRTVAARLAHDDPVVAIELFLDADEPEAAADVLAANLSEIGVERALTWLYRLPAELRRRFPPVLAAGQATVEVDAALADAERRVEAATTERARREALLALGSVEAHRGELAAAASAFEAALRTARDDPTATARISEELAGTRWLLGDVLGARAALEGLDTTPAIRWLRAQLDAYEGNDLADQGPPSDPLSLAAAGLLALARGDDASAADLSGTAYALAVEGGGEPLLAAGVVRSWSLLRAGANDDAVAVAETLERRLGPRHELGRLHAALVRERAGRAGGDTGRRERDLRRLRDLRGRGYASIEQLADRVLDRDGQTAGPALEVRVLGEHEVRCDGRTIRRADWRSKKALEVLTVVAAHGPGGARREQVIEAVWPDREPEKGRTLLRTALRDVRRTLEPDRPAGEPSRYVVARDTVLVVAGRLDLDDADEQVSSDPTGAFERLRLGLAPTVADAEWAAAWPARVERLLVRAASSLPDATERPQRITALEALIAAEPWQWDHYDRLASLHREAGDDPAAADVERRWFADE